MRSWDSPRFFLISRDRGAPLGEQQRIEGVMNAAGERCLVASDRLGDHRAQIPLSQHDQLMLVQPATCKLQQSLPIGGARELIAKDPHECATSWFAEPSFRKWSQNVVSQTLAENLTL
jgi:hypothetical protein